MEQYLNSCRVCLCLIEENKPFNNNDNKETKPEEQDISIKLFFEKFKGLKMLPEEPQTCCSFCYAELLKCLQFIEKCERTQRLLDDVRNDTILDSELKNVTLVKEESIGIGTKNESKRKKVLKKSKVEKTQKTENASKVICPYCATLVKSSYLENHIKCVHEPRHSYICDICNTTLSSKKSVIRHMNHVHLKMQKYKCKICNTQFPNESLRKAHLLQIHKVVPPKACPYCEYRAFTKAHITRHVQRHRGDRRFKCQTCSFAFVTLLQLQTHQAVHSDERNFECNECLKKFKTKKNLSAHKKCHLAYEYECGVCKRAFLTNQMMRNHVNKIHPEYELPPPGTILNKEAVKRMKNIEAEILQYKPKTN